MSRACRSRAAIVLAVAAATAGVAPATAAERWHTVVYGDSASAIAKRYYGDYAFTNLLLLANGRRGTDLRPGERLRIPYSRTHRVEPGDTGSTLAQRFLGRPSAWPAIAHLNHLDPGASLRVGRTIVMPAILRHTLARGESLAALAAAYYDDSSRAGLLQTFNGIDDPRELSIGRVVEVPVVALRLTRPPSRESEGSTRPAGTASAVPAAPARQRKNQADPLLQRAGATREAGEPIARRATRREPRPTPASGAPQTPPAVAAKPAAEGTGSPPSAGAGGADPRPETRTRAAAAPDDRATSSAPAARFGTDDPLHGPERKPAVDTEPAASPSPSPSPPEAPTPSWFAVGLADAETAYDAGEFERAQDRVLKLIERVERVPSLTDRARLWRLAAFVHVAFDRRDDACTAFRAWRAQGTPTALDPVRVSPKIRAALSACPADDPS